MSWAGPLDDGMSFHAKILAAGNEATGAWARAISWCARHLTDGKVPRAVALTIANEAVWGTLVDVRLAELDPNGWVLHDYLEWNPSAKEVRAARARKAKNVRDFRKRTVTGYKDDYETGELPSGNRLVPGPLSSLPLPSSSGISETKILVLAPCRTGEAEREPGFDLGRRVFAAEWELHYREPYAFSTRMGQGSEDVRFREVGNHAIAIGKDRAEEFLRHWARRFLRDAREFYAKDRHPGRLFSLETVRGIGNPPANKPKLVKAPENQQAPISAEKQAELAARVAGIGTGGKP